MSGTDVRFYVEIKIADSLGQIGGVGRGIRLSESDLKELSSDQVFAKLREDYETCRNDILHLLSFSEQTPDG